MSSEARRSGRAFACFACPQVLATCPQVESGFTASVYCLVLAVLNMIAEEILAFFCILVVPVTLVLWLFTVRQKKGLDCWIEEKLHIKVPPRQTYGTEIWNEAEKAAMKHTGLNKEVLLRPCLKLWKRVQQVHGQGATPPQL